MTITDSRSAGDQISEAGGQQLVARIKRSSKYYGQTNTGEWFDVRVVADAHYRLRGNNNNYRLSDVVLGVRLDDGSVVDLTSGKTSVGAEP
jgi:hypothetical protein